MLQIDLFVNDVNCPHCEPVATAVHSVASRFTKKEVKVVTHELSAKDQQKKAAEMDVVSAPTIIFPNGAKVSGVHISDMIGSIAYALISDRTETTNEGGKFHFTTEEGKLEAQLASGFIEFQSQVSGTDPSYLFTIFENPGDIPIEWYDRLAKNTTIFLLSNFDKYPNEAVADLSRRNENLHLGSIVRDNMLMVASLLTWKDRPSHSTFIRAKRKGNEYTGSWSRLLGEGKKLIRDTYLPLFLTSYTVDDTGKATRESNRQVAPVRDAIKVIEKLIKK